MAPYRSHGTGHGGPSEGDAFEVYFEQGDILRAALAEWDQSRLDRGPEPGGAVATEKYDNGTLGKLVLEHAAVRLAAQRDISRALSSAGYHDLAEKLRADAEAIAPRLREVEHRSRGVSPMSLAGSEEFVYALSELRAVLQPSILEEVTPEQLRQALGEHRSELHGARYLRKHAPTAPAPGKWYDRVPVLVRLHTALDRGRGFPWAESSPVASRKISDRYDHGAG